MNNDNTSANYGIVMSIRGSVVDVQFANKLPAIYTVLRAGDEEAMVMEVLAQIDEHRVLAIALTPTQGLARGMKVEDTGEPL
jgi:F-type H+-transporting ATPase subunit beta